jgi:hypothetical protein
MEPHRRQISVEATHSVGRAKTSARRRRRNPLAADRAGFEPEHEGDRAPDKPLY